MKKYHIGKSSEGGAVIAVFFMIIWVGVAVTMSVMAFSAAGVIGLMPLMMGVFGIVVCSLIISYHIRYRKVMEKHISSRGKVTAIGNTSYSEHSASFTLEYIYKDEYGNQAVCAATLSPDDKALFYMGQDIPVLVGGYYSFPDLDKLIVENANNRNKEEKVIIKEVIKEVRPSYKICAYCGGSVDINEKSCPYCSATEFIQQ